MYERKELAHVIIEDGKGPRGWQLTFLEENFQNWLIHSFPKNLSKVLQKRVAMMYTEREDVVLVSGGFKSLKAELMKNNATIYDLDFSKP